MSGRSIFSGSIFGGAVARSLASLLVLVALLPARAAAWCQMTSADARPTVTEPCVLVINHPGSHELEWRRRCTSISLSSGTYGVAATEGRIDEAAFRSVLTRSIATWTTVDCAGSTTGLDVAILAEPDLCSRAAHYRGGRNVHSIMFVDAGWATERLHDPRALAVNYVWHDPATGEILDADIELNEELKDFHVCTLPLCAELHPDPLTGLPRGPDSADADLENTLTHEMGHYFGIAHTPDDPTATMFAEAGIGETTKRDLSGDDMAAICAIYPPGSLAATCDPTPAGGLGLDCAAPPGCACRAAGVSGASGTSAAGAAMALVALVWVARRRPLR